MTNFAAWSNYIGHSGEGGSSDLVDIIARAEVMSSRLGTFIGLIDLSAGPETEDSIYD